MHDRKEKNLVNERSFISSQNMEKRVFNILVSYYHRQWAGFSVHFLIWPINLLKELSRQKNIGREILILNEFRL